ncbi:hypothetical protein K3495_g4055 [Podosphaera aphanis]|nr:hypothetical protein K3495_g4055 [Podosphaera aphanis]
MPYFVGEFHRQIDFGKNVRKIPIPYPGRPPLPCFIIVDANKKIISVISPGIVDLHVDFQDKNNNPYPININSPETSGIYRKCVETPTLNPVSRPIGVFICGDSILRTQDAFRAANLARKMYKKNKKYFAPFGYSRSGGNPLIYTLPVLVDGNFDRNGRISIVLDASLNVIDATLHKPSRDKECYILPYLQPQIIGFVSDTIQESDRYASLSGDVKVSLVLVQAREKCKGSNESRKL